MKFHYRKSFILIIVVALMLFISPFFVLYLAIDPLTLARSQNREIAGYLSEAKSLLEKNATRTPTNIPAWLSDTRTHIAAALLTNEDQKKALEQLAKEKSGIDLGAVNVLLASVIAMLGTLSTIILSWRKDMRDAQKELEKIKSQAPRIELP